MGGGSKCFLGFEYLMTHNDRVFAHGDKRVFWTMMFGSLHNTGPSSHVSRAT